ncbi:hypothetical protein [Sphingomonas bacterium]|uniref:hypothetical protein n=1 Tax=Sphingomonas bacterium TaxID=1895847 RepID=UPI0015753F24|nr:hypothetical protein [Sphingomonas bacterium]
MRLTTLAGVVTLALSTAALAQVARAPVERKDAPGNATGNSAQQNADDDDQPAGNDTGTPGNVKKEPAAPSSAG